MLHAILGNKAGRIEVDGKSVSVREVYKGREDMITAAIFSRIPYLSQSTRHELLSLCLPDLSRDFSQGTVEFWPRFVSAVESKSYVEPDVTIKFDWGTVLIEVKRPLDGQQRLDQWFNQISSLSRARDDGYPGDIVFLALGGDKIVNSNLLNELPKKLKREGYKVYAARQLSWSTLARSTSQLRDRRTTQASDYAVLSDINLALELYGVSSHPTFDTLPNYGLSKKQSMIQLVSWKQDNYWQALVQSKHIQPNRIASWIKHS